MRNFDKNLIFLYSENSRSRLKDLSVNLKKSQQRLKYSLKRLESESVVDNLHCIFDYSYFGMLLFRVYFKGGYISEKDKAKIITKLADNPYVVAVDELLGEFDLAIEFEAQNASRFNKELKKVCELVPTLNSYKILLNIVTHIYPGSFLVKDKELLSFVRHETIVGGDRAVEVFKPEEISLMKVLFFDPKVRMTRLAKESGMSVKTASSLLNSLKKRRVIKGFKHLVNTNRLGIFRVRLFLRLHNLREEREKELLDYFELVPEIVQAHKTVGDWDMEVDIESFENSGIRYLIIQLRERFQDIIKDFNSIEFYKTHKKAYLPSYLFLPEMMD